MSKFLKAFLLFAFCSALIASGIVAYDFFQTREKFPPQTFVGTVNVSGLDQPQALEKISRSDLSEVFSPLVTFEAEKLKFSFSPEAVGIAINYDGSIKQAFAMTHQEGYLRELRERLAEKTLRLPLVLTIDEDKLTSIVESIGEEAGSTPKDASILLYEETGGYHIEAEDSGREIKAEETVASAKKLLNEGAKVFPILIGYTSPEITEKDLRAFPPVHRLGVFTTYYGSHDSPNRIHNIRLIASWLDGLLVMPDAEFSLSDQIGDFTPERGFKEAFVIYDGALVPQLGGGTCQIGTTLYNALQMADIKIVSRYNHSFYFNIYPLGRDATVYPGQKDLKFANNTGHPILIKAVATNKRLSFRIYGTPTGKTVKFSGPAVSLLTSSGYVPSTVRQVLAADAPFRTVVKRTVYDATGAVLKEEIINSSYKLYGEKTNVPIARPEPR